MGMRTAKPTFCGWYSFCQFPPKTRTMFSRWDSRPLAGPIWLAVQPLDEFESDGAGWRSGREVGRVLALRWPAQSFVPARLLV